jgi:hypothetical protein
MPSLCFCSRVLGTLLVAGLVGCITPPAVFESGPTASSPVVRQSGKAADSSGRHEYVANGSIASNGDVASRAPERLWWSAPNALEAIARVQPTVLTNLGRPIPIVLDGKVCDSQDCLKQVKASSVAGVYLLSFQYAQYRFGVGSAALEVRTR